MKDVEALKTIGEVSSTIEVSSHVIRFWEKKFKNINPIQKENGRRYYSVDDIKNLIQIKDLLYDKKYSIKGAQKALTNKSEIQPNDEIILLKLKNLRNEIAKKIRNGA